MTQSADTTATPLSDKAFVLATDLDGTFLGGSKQERAELYGWIEENRNTVGLIFVTGRDPDFIADLCAGGVPWPEYAVGDVGTTIATVSPEAGVTPITELETEIATAWNGAGDEVRRALENQPGLTLQPTEFRYRVSYDMDHRAFDESTKTIVTDMGLDWLISDNRYFDVLPAGISKGPSLRRLLDHLDVIPGRVLTAGDTLNDLSMLACGLPAVAVGGAEPDLLAALKPAPHIYRAERHGAAGILETIAAFDMHPLKGS